MAISPYTAKGTVVNNPNPVSPGVGMYYEHSSVPKSLHALFAPQVGSAMGTRARFGLVAQMCATTATRPSHV